MTNLRRTPSLGGPEHRVDSPDVAPLAIVGFEFALRCSRARYKAAAPEGLAGRSPGYQTRSTWSGIGTTSVARSLSWQTLWVVAVEPTSDADVRARALRAGVHAVVPKDTDGEVLAEQVEKFFLIEALREHGNNKTSAAKALGITREGLHKKLRQLKLT